MKRTWINFEFTGSSKFASIRGKIRGIVNKESGKIIAHEVFETFSYYDRYVLNISDNDGGGFPYKTEHFIVLAAKQALV